MIKKIKKIHYKSFNEYKEIENFEFKQINLIYGLNGKGKSTFANFLKENIGKETGMIDKNIFETSSEKYKIFHYGESYKRNIICVDDDEKQGFSSFYMGDNINDILKEKQKIKEKMDKIEILKDGKNTKLQEYNDDIKSLKQKIAGYAREFLEKIDIDYKKPQKYTASHIKDDDFKKANSLEDNELKEFQKFTKEKTPHSIKYFSFNEFLNLLKELNALKDILKQTPENKAIERFKQDSELENFARMAIDLKQKYPQDYNTKCPLCEQSIIQIKLWENLEKHFNQEYEKLLERIKKAEEFFKEVEKELIDFRKWLDDNLVETKLILNPNKQINIDELRQEYLDSIDQINADLQKIFTALAKKYESPHKNDILLEINEVELKDYINLFLSDEIKSIVEYHNKQAKNHQATLENNIQKIKNHFIAQGSEEYLNLEDKISKTRKRIEKFDRYKECCKQLKNNLNEELKKLDNSFNELNKGLKWFFNDEIRFEKISDSHYKTQRKNFRDEWFNCKNGLSEGEKTIISIIYFINSYLSDLKELKECPLVIIDDPITSLDSQNKKLIINYILSKIINNESRGQIFILSHDKSILAKLHKDIKKEKLECFKINKNITSALQKEKEFKFGNEPRELYNKLKLYVDSNGVEKLDNITTAPRDLLESIFTMIFENDLNFTNCYDKFLERLNKDRKYTASDIQDLNHNKTGEDKESETLNMCKFVVELYEEFFKI